MSIEELYKNIGRDNLISLGLNQQSLSDAKRVGHLPAVWFDAIEGLCSKSGIKCPRDLFNFKAAQ